MDKGSRVAVIISAATLVATIGIGLSNLWYSNLLYKDQHIISETKVDYIKVTMGRTGADERMVFRPALGKFSKNAIMSHWDIYVQNLSDKPIPIKSIDIHEFLFIEMEKGKWSRIKYSFPDLNEGVIDSETNENFRPMTLMAGGTKHFIVAARVEISDVAREILSYEIANKPELTIREAERLLAGKGTDLFGNRVRFEYDQKHIDYTDYHLNKGIVAVDIIGSSGASFPGEAMWYDPPVIRAH